ncbi:MAG: cysteine desulfurase [Treponema sp.]|nr:cysteine desulfurase [Treponema sp.]
MNTIQHYFDWAATSPTDSDIAKESLEESLINWGNPSSIHSIGKAANEILTEARQRAAKAMGLSPDTIYFTSGGTESDHLALLSVLTKPAKGRILISSIEHPALREEAENLKRLGWEVISLIPDKDGIISPENVLEHLTNDTYLVIVMAVNNETGVIQPIYKIADAINNWAQGKRKPKFHVDCVQAAGKIPLNLNYKGIDSAALSSHKICGPRGIGILYLKDPIDSFLRGGGQEKGIRSGTENLYGAIAFSKCLQRYYMMEGINPPSFEFKEEYSNEFLDKISKLKGATIIPPSRMEKKELFSPYVIQAAFKNIPGKVMLRALDAKGFAISTGSACSARKNKRPVLEAMHITSDLQETSVRFSFGPHSSKEGIEDLFEAVKEINEQFNK